jgi:DNA-binding PadR family transcriptional regulator
MSRELTSLSYVVLALIGREGAATHDLVKMTHSGQRLHWAGAASKIYEQPKRLERLGYVRSEKRPGKTRDRTYYTLTDKGLAALREWLGQPSSFPRIQNEAAARVLASDLAEDERVVVESLQSLRDEIAELSALVDEAERRAATIPHRKRQLGLVRSLGRRLLEVHLEWIDDVQEELGQTRPRSADPEAAVRRPENAWAPGRASRPLLRESLDQEGHKRSSRP